MSRAARPNVAARAGSRPSQPRSYRVSSRLPPHLLRIEHVHVSVLAQALEVCALPGPSPIAVSFHAFDDTLQGSLDRRTGGLGAQSLLGSGHKVFVQLYGCSARHAYILA